MIFGGPIPPMLVLRHESGCSSTVECQPSKLATWVRLPSPAPFVGRSRGLLMVNHHVRPTNDPEERGDEGPNLAWYTYVLECCDGSYYVGITTDLHRRLNMHNEGVASRWTRPRRPVRYRYAELHGSQSEARKREIELKGWRREKKAALFTAPSNILLKKMPQSFPQGA